MSTREGDGSNRIPSVPSDARQLARCAGLRVRLCLPRRAARSGCARREKLQMEKKKKRNKGGRASGLSIIKIGRTDGQAASLGTPSFSPPSLPPMPRPPLSSSLFFSFPFALFPFPIRQRAPPDARTRGRRRLAQLSTRPPFCIPHTVVAGPYAGASRRFYCTRPIRIH